MDDEEISGCRKTRKVLVLLEVRLELEFHQEAKDSKRIDEATTFTVQKVMIRF
jgi:hypothetical protein